MEALTLFAVCLCIVFALVFYCVGGYLLVEWLTDEFESEWIPPTFIIFWAAFGLFCVIQTAS